MNKNKKSILPRPIELNEDGEVVFSAPEENTEGRIVFEKPTPLMLCNEISKLFRNTMRESNDDALVQGSYRDIIFALAHGDGKTQLEIAQHIHLKPPTVSVALVKLEEEGYVVRKADPEDARRTRVYLTDKGRAIHDKAHIAIKTLERNALKGFTETEIKRLNQLLFKVRENIINDN